MWWAVYETMTLNHKVNIGEVKTQEQSIWSMGNIKMGVKNAQ